MCGLVPSMASDGLDSYSLPQCCPDCTSPSVLASPAAGTLALQQCDDDMRMLQLEVGELQRRMHATHKTAPDVVAYDRQIAGLKAEVLRARK